MKAARIAIVGEQPFRQRPGGMNRYTHGLQSALLDAGVDVHSLLLGDPTASEDATHIVGPVTSSGVSRMRAMRRAVSEHGPFDLVDVHFAAYGGLVRSSPLVVHFQGPWAAESAAEGASRSVVAVRRLIEKSVYRRADAAVVLSTPFADLLAGYGVPPESISVIPPGIDLNHFRPRNRWQARNRLGIDPDAFVIVCTRRLVRRMGHEVLLDAVKALDHRPDLEVAIIGDGPLRQQIASRASELRSRVRMVGAVSDDQLVDWYSAADLQVVPSLELEGFGLIVPEGLACGVPAVVTNLGGMAQLMGSIDPDLVIPPGVVSALTERIEAAVQGSMPTAAACRQAAEQFSWSSIAERHLQLYRSLGVPE